MTRVEFKRFARERGYGHIDPGLDCVFAYNAQGGSIAWFKDEVKSHKNERKKAKKRD